MEDEMTILRFRYWFWKTAIRSLSRLSMKISGLIEYLLDHQFESAFQDLKKGYSHKLATLKGKQDAKRM